MNSSHCHVTHPRADIDLEHRMGFRFCRSISNAEIESVPDELSAPSTIDNSADNTCRPSNRRSGVIRRSVAASY